MCTILLDSHYGDVWGIQALGRRNIASSILHDTQQLWSLHRTYDRVLRDLRSAHIEHIARMEHLSNYNYDHLLRLIPSLGGPQKDTICKVVRIWYKERLIA